MTKLEDGELSTQRGFTFQYPPFPALDHATAEELFAPIAGALYVHVPFCPYRCAFCYYAVKINQQAEAFDDYLDHLVAEMELVAGQAHVARHWWRTAFIGGGTPTQLGARQLERLLSSLARRFELGALEEFTVEADPTTLTRDKVEVMRAHGVNRVSVGIQSFASETNALNERKHSEREGLAALELLRAAGFDNLNVDLICGLIGETEAGWRYSIDRLLELAPEHVTIYLLSLRPQTVAHVRVARGQVPEPPAEAERIVLFEQARARLLEAGYVQTTANCFVREPAFEQRHQQHCWSSEPLIGLGNSAYSYVDGCVTQNIRNLERWAAAVEAGCVPIEYGHRLGARDRMLRYLLLRLKQLRVDRAAFEARFGVDALAVCGPVFARLVELGLVTVTPAAVELTARGIIYVDDVCRSFYAPWVRGRLDQLDAGELTQLQRSLL